MRTATFSVNCPECHKFSQSAFVDMEYEPCCDKMSKYLDSVERRREAGYIAPAEASPWRLDYRRELFRIIIAGEGFDMMTDIYFIHCNFCQQKRQIKSYIATCFMCGYRFTQRNKAAASCWTTHKI